MIRPPPRSPLFPNPTLSRSLEPDTGEPVPAPASTEISGGPAASAASQGSVTELDMWKDRHLRLAAEYDNIQLCHRSRSEEHTSELQSLRHLVCRLLLVKKKN